MRTIRTKLAMVAVGGISLATLADGGAGTCGRISCGTQHVMNDGTCCVDCYYSVCLWFPSGGDCGAAQSTGGPQPVLCLKLVHYGYGYCDFPALGECISSGSTSMICVLECNPEGGGEGGN